MHARVSIGDPTRALPKVVLVHGLGVSSHYMVPTAQQLAPHCSVYAPDLPGFGKSDHPRQVLDVPGMADALHGWMDEAGLSRATILGNSMGSQVAVDLAIRYPERVEGLVLTGLTFDRRARASIVSLLTRVLLDSPWEPRSLSPIIVTDYLSAGLLRVIVTLRHGLRDPIEEKLPRVEAPTLVVRGEHDSVVPRPWAIYATRLLRNARFVEIAGASHAVNFSAAGKLASIVLPFLSEVG
ncbi:MAG: alpha/beta hydrolase [Chloroflexota bacterium]|nr:alpha/beta hydrolase [Chloroflexota bacterium]